MQMFSLIISKQDTRKAKTIEFIEMQSKIRDKIKQLQSKKKKKLKKMQNKVHNQAK